MEEDSFGNYQLIELLGRGGMGEVWRAHDTVIDRVVALKILPAQISQDELFQQRFRREAHAAARLNSPHVVPIHTHGEIDGRLFVDMRLIEGRNLQSLLNVGPLAPVRAVHIVEQIAKALHAAHKAGLLHRDVKPSNILLDDDDYAYLIDFGIARAAGDGGLTTAGDVVGTFHYMAPERFSTEPGAPPVDARSDIYALACVLYECLVAEHAFPGDSLEQQIGNHLVSPPPRPSAVKPGLPRGFDIVIAKGMAKKPGERYGTAMELARAARDVVTGPVTPPPVSPPPVAPVTPPPIAPRIFKPASQPRPPVPPPRPPYYTAPPSRAEHYGRRPTPAPQDPSTSQTLPHRLADLNPPPRREPPVAVPRPPVAVRPPDKPPAPKPRWWHRKSVLITSTALLTVVAAVVWVLAVIGNHGSAHRDSRQATLPFSGLREPEGLSVDDAGTVYVADTLHNRVLELTAGSTSPTVLPFDGLSFPTGVTTDNTGTIYVNDAGNKRVVILAPGSKAQTQLTFTDLGNPTGLTVDSGHTVYVTDTAKNKVLALAAGSNKQTELPFTGLNAPTGLVVNNKGAIYVADGGNNRILALEPGSTTQTTVPFVGLNGPGGVTVDREGAVYVTDSGDNKALKLPAGANTQVELPFTDLDYPWGLAVDNNGTVYVAGHNNKILTLRQK